MHPTNKKSKNPINQAFADSSGEDFWDYCVYNVRWYRMSRQKRKEKNSIGTIHKEGVGAVASYEESKQMVVEGESVASNLSISLIDMK